MLGCQQCDNHIWSGVHPGLNGPFSEYQRTQPSNDASIKIYGLDNEMCYTGRGLEVSRVSIVALDGSRVYDEFVKTTMPVICYNATYSGVTAKDLVEARCFETVRRDVMRIITADIILVGHELENDLRSLNIVDERVIVEGTNGFLSWYANPTTAHWTSKCERCERSDGVASIKLATPVC